MPTSRTLIELLEMERDLSIPASELPTDTSRMRRFVLHQGEWWTMREAATAVGREDKAGLALIARLISVMKQAGFRFGSTKTLAERQGEHVYRVSNPQHVPTEADLANMRSLASPHKPKADKPKADKAPKSTRAVAVAAQDKSRAFEPHGGLELNGHSQEMLDALPRLTEGVLVVGNFINEHGDVSMILRDHAGLRWRVEVAGVVQV